MTENDFKTRSDPVTFYSDLGFGIEEFPMYDDRRALSTAPLIPEERKAELLGVLSSVKAWILTPRF